MMSAVTVRRRAHNFWATFALPSPPALLPEARSELELYGADFMRVLIARALIGTNANSSGNQIRFGNVVATYGEIQDWLNWNSAKDAWWIKVGTIAAFAAAIFSLLALLK